MLSSTTYVRVECVVTVGESGLRLSHQVSQEGGEYQEQRLRCHGDCLTRDSVFERNVSLGGGCTEYSWKSEQSAGDRQGGCRSRPQPQEGDDELVDRDSVGLHVYSPLLDGTRVACRFEERRERRRG